MPMQTANLGCRTHSTARRTKPRPNALGQSRASAPSHWSRNDTGTRGLRGDVVRGLNFTLARVVVAHHKHHRALGEHVSHLLFGPFDGVRYLCKGKPLSRCGTVVRAIHAARAGQCKRVHGECDEGEPERSSVHRGSVAHSALCALVDGTGPLRDDNFVNIDFRELPCSVEGSPTIDGLASGSVLRCGGSGWRFWI